MRYLLAISLLLYSMQSSAHSDRFSFNQADKRLHFGLSMAGTYFGALLLKKLKVPYPQDFAAGIVLTAGFAKEMTDPVCSQGDMVADVLGVATGYALYYVVRF